MSAARQPRPEAESLHEHNNYYMSKRIGKSTADDSHGWIFAEVVYD